LTNDHDVSRSEVVICTKGGYLPFDGTQPRNVRDYVESTFVRPGIASLDDFVGGVHCMTPAYLQNQLEQSMRNMNIDCVDVYYIHNPESQLGYITETEFYYRLRLAFERLEENRAQGKLQWYGVATWNGFRVANTSREYHSLSRMVQIARETGGENSGFRFVQMPFNLAMPEALTLLNQTVDNQELTTLEAAERLGITVVASASMLQGRVARGLPDSVRKPLGSLPTDALTAVQFVRSTPGITTALIGMSQVGHVEENLKLVNIEPVRSDNFEQLFS
jgi:aryl-alcohol dehydrogenase-like predicted oxidoreductase